MQDDKQGDTENQIGKYEQIFEDSFSRVLGKGTGISAQGDLFFSRFYENFLRKSAVIEQMFSQTDMDQQVRMLQKSFFQLINMYVSGSPPAQLFNIAKTHSVSGHNVRPELYDLWLDALIDTVEQLDPEFEDNITLAWRLALNPGIVLMKHYHDKPQENPAASD
jgi:hemoglobin-like flavoprotein